MEENSNEKNNIQETALNVSTEKPVSKYYSNQKDSINIIQENTDNFNTKLEISLNKLFSNTEYKIINNCLYKETHKKDNILTKKLCNFVPYAKNEKLLDDGIDQKRLLTIGGIHCTGKQLQDIQISSTEFSNLNWITRTLGVTMQH